MCLDLGRSGAPDTGGLTWYKQCMQGAFGHTTERCVSVLKPPISEKAHLLLAPPAALTCPVALPRRWSDRVRCGETVRRWLWGDIHLGLLVVEGSRNQGGCARGFGGLAGGRAREKARGLGRSPMAPGRHHGSGSRQTWIVKCGVCGGGARAKIKQGTSAIKFPSPK